MRKKYLQAGLLVLILGAVIYFGWAVDKNTQSVPVMGEETQEQTGTEGQEVEELPETPPAEYYWDDLDVMTPHLESGEEMQEYLPVKVVGDKITGLKSDEIPTLGTFYRSKAPLIAIDPGHLGETYEGYYNTGAVSVFGTVEFEFTMAVANVLKDELISRGYDVYMVRTTNKQKEYPYHIGHRSWAINSMGCDAVVALHWDSYAQESANGWHAIYKGDKESDSYLLAKSISDAYEDALDGAIRKYCEPVSRDDLWMLNVVQMPAMFLECGFSSNYSDATWLEDEDNHLVIAKAIADGLDAYFEEKSDDE